MEKVPKKVVINLKKIEKTRVPFAVFGKILKIDFDFPKIFELMVWSVSNSTNGLKTVKNALLSSSLPKWRRLEQNGHHIRILQAGIN